MPASKARAHPSQRREPWLGAFSVSLENPTRTLPPLFSTPS